MNEEEKIFDARERLSRKRTRSSLITSSNVQAVADQFGTLSAIIGAMGLAGTGSGHPVGITLGQAALRTAAVGKAADKILSKAARELKQKEAERKRQEAERKRQEAERKRQEAERKRQEAERKRQIRDEIRRMRDQMDRHIRDFDIRDHIDYAPDPDRMDRISRTC